MSGGRRGACSSVRFTWMECFFVCIPIFLSLSASFFFYQFLINKKIANVFLSGIFISAACLFHQIHLFWGIALFAGFLRIRNLKSIIAFCLTVLLVPIVYSLVLVFYLKINFTLDNLLRFAAEYFFSDNRYSSEEKCLINSALIFDNIVVILSLDSFSI